MKKIYEVSEVMEHYKGQIKCADCEMCMADDKGIVCAGEYYGKQLSPEDLKHEICEGYDVSLPKYIELEEKMHK